MIVNASLSENIIIHWFRQDLRISDNPSLVEAALEGHVLPIYILDDINSGEHKMGSSSRSWLHSSLSALDKSLEGKLSVYIGEPEQIILDLVCKYNVKGVFWNRCYEPWQIVRDQQIKATLAARSIEARSFKGSLLWEPWEVLKKDATPYKVFTPYYRKGCLQASPPKVPFPKPSNMSLHIDLDNKLRINDLDLLPKIRWDQGLLAHWQVGETHAQLKLDKFIENHFKHYKIARDFPALDAVSRLSPHLHFGELSPNQVWHAAKNNEATDDLDHFLSELGWREFSYSLLYQFPDLPSNNLQPKFDRFPWLENEEYLRSWQTGQTGHPLVDAGMRELWQTGYMHNRIRMVVGSFLVKNLLLHWHHGEAWFWDCLFDADLAVNSASWQWIAGCGADAAPYFRVFNPSTQGYKFDPEGEYTRRFVPELKHIPDKYLFRPWEAPDDILHNAGVKLGDNYPYPIVDLKQSRLSALEAFQSLKNAPN